MDAPTLPKAPPAPAADAGQAAQAGLPDDVDTIAFSEELMQPFLRAASVEEDEFMEEYLWNVSQYLNEHVRFSDTKAGSVIVLAGALLSLLYGGGLHRTFAAVPISEWTLRTFGALVTYLLLGSSVLCASWSIRPRMAKNVPTGFVFWESILAYGSPASFLKAVNTTSRQALLDNLAIQLYVVSGICSTKFRWVGRSITLCLAGALLAAVVLVTG